jgi:hypothetical protein
MKEWAVKKIALQAERWLETYDDSTVREGIIAYAAPAFAQYRSCWEERYLHRENLCGLDRYSTESIVMNVRIAEHRGFAYARRMMYDLTGKEMRDFFAAYAREELIEKVARALRKGENDIGKAIAQVKSALH